MGKKKGTYCHLDGVLVLVRLLVRVLGEEVPGRASVLGGVQLPAPQGQRAVGEAQRQRGQGLVDGVVVLLQVPVVVEVHDGVVVAAHRVELHVWGKAEGAGTLTGCGADGQEERGSDLRWSRGGGTEPLTQAVWSSTMLMVRLGCQWEMISTGPWLSARWEENTGCDM